MNKQTYINTRRSIRDNGLRYTYKHAIDTDDTDTMFVCEDIADLMKQTDWLAMRVRFARCGEDKTVAIRLTTTIKRAHHG
mgnify:CR=1 FL=1